MILIELMITLPQNISGVCVELKWELNHRGIGSVAVAEVCIRSKDRKARYWVQQAIRLTCDTRGSHGGANPNS